MRRFLTVAITLMAAPLLTSASYPPKPDSSPHCQEVFRTVDSLIRQGEAAGGEASNLALDPRGATSLRADREAFIAESRAKLLPAWQQAATNPECFTSENVAMAIQARDYLVSIAGPS